MKQFSGIISLALLLLFSASCIKEKVADLEDDGILIPAQMENGPTKASYDGTDGKFAWSIGDHIALYNDGAYTSARLAKISGNTGYFALPLPSTSRSHYALYPFEILDEGHFGNDPEGLWINYPDSYFVENSETGWKDSLAVYTPAPMIAVNTEGEKLYFKHLGAVLRITLNNIPSGTRIINFQTGETITGKFRVTNPASNAPVISLADDVASGHGKLVRVHFRQIVSGNLTLNLPIPPGDHSLLRVTTHSDYNQAASGWGNADKNRSLSRGEARKITLDLSNSAAHLFSFAPAANEISIIKDLTAILPYTAMKTASAEVAPGDGLSFTCHSSNPAVAVADITPDDGSNLPVIRIVALSAGTTTFTIKASLAGQTLYSVLKVNVAALTGARVDVVGLPNMLNGRDKQTLTPTVWTEPASSKELDYEWTFDWESDNTSSATVDSDGLVTAGTTDGQANISCKVTILGNDYFGGYCVNVVTNPPGTLPGVFTFDEYGHYCFFAKTNLVYWKAEADDGYYEGYDRFDPLGSMRRGLFALGKNQYDYYTGRIYNGNINYRPVTNQATPGFDKFHFLVPQTLFSSSASTERIYALDYITEPDPKNWYNMGLHKIEYPIVEDLGTGWYAPSIGQWNYILFSRRASTIGTSRHCRFVRTVITGLAKEKTNDAYVRGLLILPDIYVHPDGLAAFQRINERNTEVSSSSWSVYNNAFTQFTADQLAQLEAAGCVFLASGGWYHGEYENSSNEMTARTDCTVSINSGGWYFDNMLYKDSLNESLRVYTYSGGTLGYYYGTWTSSSTACWDWRFSIRLIRDDGTFIHDYTRDDPVNW